MHTLLICKSAFAESTNFLSFFLSLLVRSYMSITPGECGSTRPWVKSARVKSAWSHGGNMFNRKEFIQQKLEEGCLIIKKNVILCAAYSIFRTRDTLNQLNTVDVVSLAALIIL